MPTIVDATIQGKLQHPIMPNVLTANDRMDLSRTASGITEVAAKNVAKINQSKGIPAIPAQVKTTSEGARQSQAIADENTSSIGEQFKGRNFNAVA